MILKCLINIDPIHIALHWTHQMVIQMIQMYSLIDDQKIGLTSLKEIISQETCHVPTNFTSILRIISSNIYRPIKIMYHEATFS